MTYCHECGEEIAEIDTFCPFCGISIQPTIDSSEKIEAEADTSVVEDPEEIGNVEESQADTIAISGDEIADLISQEVTEKEIEAAPVAEEIIEPIEEEESLDKKVNKEVKAITETTEEIILDDSTKQKYQTEPEEYVPEEKLLFTARSLTDKKPQVVIEDDNIELEIDQPVSEPAIPDNSSDEPDVEKSAIADKIVYSESSQTESSMMSYEETEIKEKTSVEETPEATEATAMTDAEEIDFTATIPYIPIDSKVGEVVQTKQEEVEENIDSSSSAIPATPDILKNDMPEVAESKIEEESNKVEEDDIANHISDEPIKPPAEELKEPEPVKSKFDSVRIRARDEDEKNSADVVIPRDITPDYAEPVITTETAQAVSESQESAPEPTVSNDEPISYTTPNIGGTETDGKKSKLKPLDEGTILNERYEIIRKIGGGGMGAVYLASDKNLGGVLRAVKEMVQSYIEEEQQDKAINDFKRESLLLTSLEHPAIPTIYDYFYDEKEGRFYLVMKYINGGDLSSRLHSEPEGRIDEKTITDWAIQVADVLSYLHNRQPPIVYRDLKPANIMIDGNTGRVMLIDFGIARWINKEEKGVTAVGTMGYAPPELFSGNVEPSSDIYSLGSTMFHLLTGSDPQSNPLLIFDFQKNPKPREINPQLSDQMERILMRMVEYNADKRFTTVKELKKVLEAHFENLNSGKISYGVKASPSVTPLSDEKVFCGFCGQKIVASDLFCAFCGAKQPIASKGVHGEEYSSAPITASLVIMGTNELESPSYIIEKDENLVGRRDPMSNIFPEVDLSKYDPQTKISRRHARIWREGKNFMVEDLGSSNGTVLMPILSETTRLVANKPHILTNGDKLKVGDTTLHFVIG